MLESSMWKHTIREKVLQGHIEMKYIKIENQVANIFTNGLSGPKTTRSKIKKESHWEGVLWAHWLSLVN